MSVTSDPRLAITYEDPGVYLVAELGALRFTLCNGMLTAEHLDAIGAELQGAPGRAVEELVTIVTPSSPAPPREIRSRLVDVLVSSMPALQRAVWIMAGDSIAARFNRSIMRALLPLLLRRLDAQMFVVDTTAAATRRLVDHRPAGHDAPSALAIERAIGELWRRIDEVDRGGAR